MPDSVLKTAKPVVILDRDGVINVDSDQYIKTLDEWIPIEGSIEAIVKLKRAGFIVAIATNQSGVGRGFFSIETLNAMHDKLAALLASFNTGIDYIAYCPHRPEQGCDCRKPKSGLFEEIAAALSIDLHGAIVVGDSLRDIQAGVNVGCKPVLVLTGKGQTTLARSNSDKADLSEIGPAQLPANTQVFNSLSDFVSQTIGD